MVVVTTMIPGGRRAWARAEPARKRAHARCCARASRGAISGAVARLGARSPRCRWRMIAHTLRPYAAASVPYRRYATLGSPTPRRDARLVPARKRRIGVPGVWPRAGCAAGCTAPRCTLQCALEGEAEIPAVRDDTHRHVALAVRLDGAPADGERLRLDVRGEPAGTAEGDL